MPILDNIERITTPAVEVFEREYLLQQKPVIITDLFAAQPISQINTITDAKTHLGEIQLVIQEEFSSFTLRTTNLLDQRKKRFWSLQQYLEYVEQHPETRLMSTEGSTPAEIVRLFDLPAYTQINRDPSFPDIASLLFLGNAGNYAHLHFDGDYRQVLLHQVFGTKRVILIPANQAKKLSPIGNFSSIFLENFSESDKTAFVEYTHGYECLLQPGETVFMPAGIWHYLEYYDTGMSFSIRFGRNRYLRFFGDRLHPTTYLQNIATHFLGAAIGRPQRDLFQELAATYDQSYATPLEKAQALQTKIVSIYDRLYPNEAQRMYAFTNFDALIETFLTAEAERLYRCVMPSLQSILLGWSRVGV
jgi:Cupin-like domain